VTNDTTNSHTFGGEGAPKGTVCFNVDLVRETEEYGRQLVVYPKAHHPQMESLVALKKQDDKVVMSLATCGFNQLATMKDVPEELAEEYDIPQWAFRSSGVVNVSASILDGVVAGQRPILTDYAVNNLQTFLVLYAEAVWRMGSPLVMMINPVCKDENEYEGVSWFTFTVAFVMAVDQEEWIKLYKMKALEFNWAARVYDMALARADLSASLVIEKTKRSH